MSKKESALLQKARTLVDDVKRTHEYSMSRIYGMYTEITGKRETPQSCPSCLIRKVRFIENWINEEEKRQASVVPTLGKEETKED